MQTISTHSYLGLIIINISYFPSYVFITYVHKCKYVHIYIYTIYTTVHLTFISEIILLHILAMVSLHSFILPCYQFQ